jgi:hypothetical protein
MSTVATFCTSGILPIEQSTLGTRQLDPKNEGVQDTSAIGTETYFSRGRHVWY